MVEWSRLLDLNQHFVDFKSIASAFGLKRDMLRTTPINYGATPIWLVSAGASGIRSNVTHTVCGKPQPKQYAMAS